jgi:hypothetical protein
MTQTKALSRPHQADGETHLAAPLRRRAAQDKRRGCATAQCHPEHDGSPPRDHRLSLYQEKELWRFIASEDVMHPTLPPRASRSRRLGASRENEPGGSRTHSFGLKARLAPTRPGPARPVKRYTRRVDDRPEPTHGGVPVRAPARAGKLARLAQVCTTDARAGLRSSRAAGRTRGRRSGRARPGRRPPAACVPCAACRTR